MNNKEKLYMLLGKACEVDEHCPLELISTHLSYDDCLKKISFAKKALSRIGFNLLEVENENLWLGSNGTSIRIVKMDDPEYEVQTGIAGLAAGLAASGVDFLGGYNASTNLFPTVGSGSGGSVQRGDLWIITVAGTLGGRSVLVNDSLLALVNSPGQTSTNWAINSANLKRLQANIVGATQAIKKNYYS